MTYQKDALPLETPAKNHQKVHNCSTHNKQKKVTVGLSGGVDSAVAALFLKQQGYQVKAVFMQNWQADPNDPYCSAPQDLQDARRICEKLSIPMEIINFSQEYWVKVFQYFLNEYSAGRTPNPDVLCNKEIKFKTFLDYALKHGADYIATGHYAQISYENHKYHLLKSVDQNKDQSYFLYLLSQEQLKYSLFPLGNLTKPQVRKIAAQNELHNSNKKDSTGICFIGERKFKQFLNEYLLSKPGNIVTTENEVIGKHDGLMFYTLGQRKGLGVGGKKNAAEKAWYVVKKDLENNLLIIDQNHNHPLLLACELTCSHTHWISGKSPDLPYQCSAKIRYRQQDENCTICSCEEDICYVKFDQPQHAITPGQAIVFYQGNECLGGGTIKNN